MYHIKKQYRLRKEEDGAGLMFDRSTQEVYVLNTTAMWIMSMLDRKPCDLDEMVSGIDSTFEGAEHETVSKEVKSFVLESTSNGFVEECQA